MSDLVRIAYGDDAHALRIEYDWPTLPTALFIYATQMPGGTSLLSDSVAPYDAGALDAAVSSGGTSIAFATTPDDLPVHGDRYRIAESADGAAEDVKVDYFDSDTDTLHLDRPLMDAHTAAAVVSPLFAVYDLDASTTTTWTLGTRVRIRVSPSDSAVADAALYPALSYEARVVDSAYDDTELREDFRQIYPEVYTLIDDRWGAIYDATRRRVRGMLMMRGKDIDALADQSLLSPLMLEQMYLLGAPRGDEWQYEREQAATASSAMFDTLASTATWWDNDQDDVVDADEDEVTPMVAWLPVGRGL